MSGGNEDDAHYSRLQSIEAGKKDTVFSSYNSETELKTDLFFKLS